MIYDTFLFGGGETEHHLLQMRLEELADVPDLVHVLVESTIDHQGHSKPLWYADHQSSFSFGNRIYPVVADLPGPDAASAWHRERTQREHIRTGLYAAGVQKEDVVLLCDVDELPSHDALHRLVTKDIPCILTLNMDVSMFAVDWVLPEQQDIAVAGLWGDMSSFSLGMLRDNSYRKANPAYEHAGHHFSWLGGPEEIVRKCGYFCHDELRDMILEGNKQGWWYEEGTTWYGRRWTSGELSAAENLYQMVPANVTDSWPSLIREHRCPDAWFRPKI